MDKTQPDATFQQGSRNKARMSRVLKVTTICSFTSPKQKRFLEPLLTLLPATQETPPSGPPSSALPAVLQPQGLFIIKNSKHKTQNPK
ncbi:hypothetical protein A2482_04795 [Candidatus Falkowbacteria bacterium RIFOXYC2_FULL_48_21]|uniref:Uncharacterized protein n=1 Tax=Candidatus Falkowbacteria bacterium RIFOXYC2_FULL_48_21 TaxID=1798005 RepID=A0A1F5TEF1_9BACT|nr:MAG: hypothetical protein A2482_04795 [Candidatus Falkowbacteria bacterium RIFOXYC2_FULL_48_21]